MPKYIVPRFWPLGLDGLRGEGTLDRQARGSLRCCYCFARPPRELWKEVQLAVEGRTPHEVHHSESEAFGLSRTTSSTDRNREPQTWHTMDGHDSIHSNPHALCGFDLRIDLRALLLQRERVPQDARIHSFSLSGAALELLGRTRSPPAADRPIRLVLRHAWRRESIGLAATIKNLSREGERIWLSCQFLSVGPLRTWLPGDAWARLNRRSLYRVRLRDAELVSLVAEHQRCILQGRLLDLSEAGLGAAFQGQLATQCGSGHRIGIRLCLPHCNRELRLAGNAVRVDSRDGEVQCGIVLDRPWGGGSQRLEEALAAFVMSRQREEIQLLDREVE